MATFSLQYHGLLRCPLATAGLKHVNRNSFFWCFFWGKGSLLKNQHIRAFKLLDGVGFFWGEGFPPQKPAHKSLQVTGWGRLKAFVEIKPRQPLEICFIYVSCVYENALTACLQPEEM